MPSTLTPTWLWQSECHHYNIVMKFLFKTLLQESHLKSSLFETLKNKSIHGAIVNELSYQA